jgi:hypothetical protein
MRAKWLLISFSLLGFFLFCESYADELQLVEYRDASDPTIVIRGEIIRTYTYLESLNEEMKILHYKRPPKRSLVLFGKASEYEKQIGAKVRIPF